MSGAAVDTVADALRRRSSRRRRRRAVLLVGIAAAFITAAVFYLGSTGSTGLTITTPPGTTGGAVASVYTGSNLSGGTTKGKVTSGLPVARIVAAKDYIANSNGKNVRIGIAWTNASDSALNGKDVIGVGLYYPVTTITSSGSCPSDTLTITDSDAGGGVCLKQDQAVTGKNVDTGSSDTYYGLIPLVASTLTGYFLPAATPGSGTCASNGTGEGGGWCLLSSDTTDTGTMYLVAQVLNPAGHAPPGQQPSPGALDFFVRASAVG